MTRHLEADIWEVRPREATQGRSVDLLWASPDCTHFSVAKGGKPRSQGIRSLAWAVVRWAREVRPAVIFLENVSEFRGWGPLDPDDKPIRARMGETFRRWKRELDRLGYTVDHRILDASHYGAPTRRRRLFLVARRDGQPIRWPFATHGGLGLRPLRTAAECIDWSLPCSSIFERKRPLAEKTLQRIAHGIHRFVLRSPSPFIVGVGGPLVAPSLIQTGYGDRKGVVAAFLAKHYGGVVGQGVDAPLGTVTATYHHSLVSARLGQSAQCHTAEVRAFLTSYYGSGVGQSLGEPLRTVTSKDRFGLVTVAGVDFQIVDIGMRMLEPHELLRAQFGRFASGYDLSPAKTKSAKVRLIGNSVAPECAER